MMVEDASQTSTGRGVEELSKIPEIGELAQKIVELRSEQGPFGNIQHPGNVTGVGEEARKALRNRVRFELGDGVGKNLPS